MVVAAGDTVAGTPLVATPTPLSIAPVPFAKTGVRSTEPPAVIVADDAVNEVIVGAATAWMVVLDVAVEPVSAKPLLTVST